jgi:hypothetical protein
MKKNRKNISKIALNLKYNLLKAVNLINNLTKLLFFVSHHFYMLFVLKSIILTKKKLYFTILI